MPKNISSLKILYAYFFAIILCLPVFSQENKNYQRFIDSADVYIDTSSKKSLAFLDSIPEPLTENIEGRLADYYSFKALINDDFKQYSELHRSYILALKYAEVEDNCEVAGVSCLELFYNMYFVDKDSTAHKYLERAKMHFESCDYEYGLTELEQTYAYVEFLDSNYKASIELILDKLDNYKKLNDKYYYMFATYMLTSNYTYLDDKKNINKYFKEFEFFKKDSTIADYNYLSFKSDLHIGRASMFFSKKQIDSTLHYLKKTSGLTDYMGIDVMQRYYTLYANTYKYSGNIELSKSYIDSLMIFDNKMYSNTLNASFKTNDSLSKVEFELQEEGEKKFFYGILISVFFLVLIFIGYLYFLFYKEKKLKLKSDFSTQESNLTYLKSNNEKLIVKVQGLEEYIVNLKKEVKTISSINDPLSLREGIKGFYKNLHLNSSTLLDKTENHLELVNDLNVDFFKKTQELYPQLNNSEVIICYYLFIGFKNKEIAVFLNTTLRAIESKRYRITKKINLEQKTTLKEHLEATF